MKSLGRLSFILSLPLLRIYLRRSRRAYGLIICGTEVVLVKGWLGRQKWQLPGGGTKRGETSQEAVVREVKEEVGLDIKPENLKYLLSGRWQTDSLGHDYDIYECRVAKKKPLTTLRPELIETAWVKAVDIDPADCPAEIVEALRAANLL